nr:MAG TPA: hypothetical protein [Crassvirales sp.]
MVASSLSFLLHNKSLTRSSVSLDLIHSLLVQKQHSVSSFLLGLSRQFLAHYLPNK